MLERLIAGEEDPTTLAALAHGTVRASQEELARALHGVVGAHQRWLLHHNSAARCTQPRIGASETEIGRRLVSRRQCSSGLQTIPGVGPQTAQELVAVIGTDMSRFPTHRHLASWAKLCPGLHESGGRRRLHRHWSRAQAPPRHPHRGCPLTGPFADLPRCPVSPHRARRGGKRAAIAVAHTILIIAYHLIKDGTTYQDLGPNYFDERDKTISPACYSLRNSENNSSSERRHRLKSWAARRRTSRVGTHCRCPRYACTPRRGHRSARWAADRSA